MKNTSLWLSHASASLQTFSSDIVFTPKAPQTSDDVRFILIYLFWEGRKNAQNFSENRMFCL